VYVCVYTRSTRAKAEHVCREKEREHFEKYDDDYVSLRKEGVGMCVLVCSVVVDMFVLVCSVAVGMCVFVCSIVVGMCVFVCMRVYACRGVFVYVCV